VTTDIVLRGPLARKFLALYRPRCKVSLGKGEVGAVRTWLPRRAEAAPNDLLVILEELVAADSHRLRER